MKEFWFDSGHNPRFTFELKLNTCIGPVALAQSRSSCASQTWLVQERFWREELAGGGVGQETCQPRAGNGASKPPFPGCVAPIRVARHSRSASAIRAQTYPFPPRGSGVLQNCIGYSGHPVALLFQRSLGLCAHAWASVCFQFENFRCSWSNLFFVVQMQMFDFMQIKVAYQRGIRLG